MTDTIQQFNYDADLLQTILWQYENAPNLNALLEAKQGVFDTNQSQFWRDFYTNIFDIKTANYFGLSVWSIILGAPIIYNTLQGNKPTWGFGAFHKNFNNGNFASTGGTVVNYPLTLETARAVLRLRYYQLTGSCCVPDINRALADVFENYGRAWVQDNHDMTQTYFFDFALPSDMAFAFTNFDVLPRPAGVGSNYVVLLSDAPFGFNSDASNFDNSNFYGAPL